MPGREVAVWVGLAGLALGLYRLLRPEISGVGLHYGSDDAGDFTGRYREARLGSLHAQVVWWWR